MKRARRVGFGVMERASIAWKSKTELVVENGNLKADDYFHLFEDHFLLLNEYIEGGNDILQQDNAPTHAVKQK